MEVILRIPVSENLENITEGSDWYDVELCEADSLNINLEDYKINKMICGMAERGKKSNCKSVYLDGYELYLESK
jgi:hypothetical protein